MKNSILFLLLFASICITISAQNKNRNPHKVKLFLVGQEVEKGLLYRVDQDSVLIADYSRKKNALQIGNIKTFEISKIKMIKTLGLNQTQEGAQKGAIIGVIPGAVFGILLMLWENEVDGEVNVTIPFALAFSAATFGIGAALGAAIGTNYIEYEIDYSFSNYERVRNELRKKAYYY